MLQALTVVVDKKDAADAVVLLPCRPPVLRTIFAATSPSEESTSLDDEAIFVVCVSLGLEDATVARRDF